MQRIFSPLNEIQDFIFYLLEKKEKKCIDDLKIYNIVNVYSYREKRSRVLPMKDKKKRERE